MVLPDALAALALPDALAAFAQFGATLVAPSPLEVLRPAEDVLVRLASRRLMRSALVPPCARLRERHSATSSSLRVRRKVLVSGMFKGTKFTPVEEEGAELA